MSYFGLFLGLGTLILGLDLFFWTLTAGSWNRESFIKSSSDFSWVLGFLRDGWIYSWEKSSHFGFYKASIVFFKWGGSCKILGYYIVFLNLDWLFKRLPNMSGYYLIYGLFCILCLGFSLVLLISVRLLDLITFYRLCYWGVLILFFLLYILIGLNPISLIPKDYSIFLFIVSFFTCFLKGDSINFGDSSFGYNSFYGIIVC